MSTAAHTMAHARRRIDAGRCVRCAVKLPPDRKTWRCADCVIENRTHAASSYQAAKAKGLCPSCRKPWQSAEHITCPLCREKAAARAGKGKPRKILTHTPDYYSRKKLKALDASMAFACKRCGLRGDHVCIEGDATVRSGPGRIYPEGQ